ncbi:hypothetical protein DMENIID0001_061020 [Sergentomyia squamirostris]
MRRNNLLLRGSSGTTGWTVVLHTPHPGSGGIVPVITIPNTVKQQEEVPPRLPLSGSISTPVSASAGSVTNRSKDPHGSSAAPKKAPVAATKTASGAATAPRVAATPKPPEVNKAKEEGSTATLTQNISKAATQRISTATQRTPVVTAKTTTGDTRAPRAITTAKPPVEVTKAGKEGTKDIRFRRAATAPKRPPTRVKKTKIAPVTTLLTAPAKRSTPEVAKLTVSADPPGSTASGSREAIPSEKPSTSAGISDPTAGPSSCCLLGPAPIQITDPGSLQHCLDLLSSPSRRAVETPPPQLLSPLAATPTIDQAGPPGISKKRATQTVVPFSQPPPLWKKAEAEFRYAQQCYGAPAKRSRTRGASNNPGPKPTSPPTDPAPTETSVCQGRIGGRGNGASGFSSTGSSGRNPQRRSDSWE